MLRIKLSRTGKKNAPLYRVVVAEKRSKRDGKVTEVLGHYNPKDPKNKLTINQDRYKFWKSKGAQPTATVASLAEK